MRVHQFRFKLGEVDQGAYERGDEWFTFDPVALMDSPAADLEEIEAQLPADLSLAIILVELYGSQRSRGVRAAMWVARRLAGVDEAYETFTPHTLRALLERQPAARPPDQDSPEQTEETTPGSSTSSDPGESASGSSTSPPA